MSRLLQTLRAVASSSRSTLRSFHTSRIAREHYINADDQVRTHLKTEISADLEQVFKSRALDAAAARPVLVDFYATSVLARQYLKRR